MNTAEPLVHPSTKAWEALASKLEGELHYDKISRALYATDASLYQIIPSAVCIPNTKADLQAIIEFCQEWQIPITPRGGATSLAGQTVNRGIQIDFSKYFDQIIAIDPGNQTATVQPGVTRDQLNKAVAAFGLHFAPDPATSARASIGGMIANNSSGTRSIQYGITIDHVLGLEVLLSNGKLCRFGMTDAAGQVENQYEKAFRELITPHRQVIEDSFPKILRKVNGYPLDVFFSDPSRNLAKLFCGSEGSLGIITEAKVKLTPLPKYVGICTVHFSDRMASIRAVKDYIWFKPASVELLDYHVLDQSAQHPTIQSLHHRVVQGRPEATLTVEFFRDSAEELKQILNDFQSFASKDASVYAAPITTDPTDLAAASELRKQGLGLIMGDPGGRKPLPFIEDSAIPLEHLPTYVQIILDACAAEGVETILYAHASVGVLHIRPVLDLTKQSDQIIFKKLSELAFSLVKKWKGSWSGEHGDGRVRGGRLREFFGPEVYELLVQTKKIFDPAGIMNPGVIIDVPEMTEDLRMGTDYHVAETDYAFKYRHQHSFAEVVHNCSGVGACRNLQSGAMCPSFKATRDEKDSTRGRANILRLAMSRQMDLEDLAAEEVREVLNRCLSCKACKHECPSGVDMAKLKSEILHKHHKKNGTKLAELPIKYNDKITKWSAKYLAPVINPMLQSTIGKSVLHQLFGISKERTLPSYQYQKLNISKKTTAAPKGEIGLFMDTYLQYYEPNLAAQAAELLQSIGYEVVPVQVGCCQRPQISNGFLDYAKDNGTRLSEELRPYLDRGLQILVIEPSCASALMEDLPDLLEDDALAKRMETQIHHWDVFLADAVQSGQIKGKFSLRGLEPTLLHQHCHLPHSDPLRQWYQNLGVQFTPKNCCGMAGAFGYQEKYLPLSKSVAELGIVPAIQQASDDMRVCAGGFSCRHQIQDFTQRSSGHILQYLDYKEA